MSFQRAKGAEAALRSLLAEEAAKIGMSASRLNWVLFDVVMRLGTARPMFPNRAMGNWPVGQLFPGAMSASRPRRMSGLLLIGPGRVAIVYERSALMKKADGWSRSTTKTTLSRTIYTH
jgi:hypothetical protein